MEKMVSYKNRMMVSWIIVGLVYYFGIEAIPMPNIDLSDLNLIGKIIACKAQLSMFLVASLVLVDKAMNLPEI